MTEAFQGFKQIFEDKTLTIEQKQRAWLKNYEGKHYSIAENEVHKMRWKKEPKKYSDNCFSSEINMIKELPNRLKIEYDTTDDKGNKDKIKCKDNLKKALEKLYEINAGFILSSHKGSCDYISVEFNRNLTEKEKENFLLWICPPGAKADLNFASHKRIFQVLFSRHWRHSEEFEMPYFFQEGSQIDYDNLFPKEEEQDEYKTYQKPVEYSEEEKAEAIEYFKDKNLLKNILDLISEDHLEDDNLKMLLFLCEVSALLKNPKRRISIAVKGKSSEGKDNAIHATLKHIPLDAFIFLTSGTQATIEDDIKDKRIIAFSEVNLAKEEGANKNLIEIIKQKTEGGTSSIKKDIRSGMKTARYEKGEQATIIYGTTDINKEEEIATRFIEANIHSTPSKIQTINENTLDTFSDKDKLLKDTEKKDSWLRIGLTNFFNLPEQYEVIIPYAAFLKEKINDNPIFDNQSPRSQRDLKRVLSLTCAMTYLFQLQRQVIDYNNQKLLISEPQDLINTLKFSSEFFNQSYSGLDGRLIAVLKLVQEEEKTGKLWIARDWLQEQIDCSRNTIKEYCGLLAGQGCLKGVKGSELNFENGLKIYDGNKIYYQSCQKGVKKPLIRCQLKELREFLEKKTQKTFDTFEDELFTNKNKNHEEKSHQNKGVKIDGIDEFIQSIPQNNDKNDKNNASRTKIDTFLLTPLNEKSKVLDDLDASQKKENSFDIKAWIKKNPLPKEKK